MVKLAHKPNLTAKQLSFARAIIEGYGPSDAYRRAYDTKASAKIVSIKAAQLRRKPLVAEYIAAAQAQCLEETLITRSKKRQVLTKIILNPRHKPMERIAAIKVDNEMTGDSMIRVEQEVTLSVILRNLEAGSVVPTEEERAMLAKPVEALTPHKAEAAPQPHTNGHGNKVMGPFAADFAELDMEVAPDPSKCVPGASLTPKRREYED